MHAGTKGRRLQERKSGNREGEKRERGQKKKKKICLGCRKRTSGATKKTTEEGEKGKSHGGHLTKNWGVGGEQISTAPLARRACP